MGSKGDLNINLLDRKSGRIKNEDKKKVLDAATRDRRERHAMERLEMDNFQQDPFNDIVVNKKAPKFLNTLEKSKVRRCKGKKKSAEYYNKKFKRTFEQLIKADQHKNPDPPNYSTIEALPSSLPRRVFCAVCGFRSIYTCTTCGARYCSILCLNKHKETRCLKWAI